MMIGNVWISPAMVPELCSCFSVHRTTVTRWMKKKRLPPAVYQLLDIVNNGNIGRIHFKWEGWQIHPKDGDLMQPDRSRKHREIVSPGRIMSMQYQYHLVAELKANNANLEAKCSSLERKLANLEQRYVTLAQYLESIREPNVVEWRSRNLG